MNQVVNCGDEVRPDVSSLAVTHERGFRTPAPVHIVMSPVAKGDVLSHEVVRRVVHRLQLVEVVDQAVRIGGHLTAMRLGLGAAGIRMRLAMRHAA